MAAGLSVALIKYQFLNTNIVVSSVIAIILKLSFFIVLILFTKAYIPEIYHVQLFIGLNIFLIIFSRSILNFLIRSIKTTLSKFRLDINEIERSLSASLSDKETYEDFISVIGAHYTLLSSTSTKSIDKTHPGLLNLINIANTNTFYTIELDFLSPAPSSILVRYVHGHYLGAFIIPSTLAPKKKPYLNRFLSSSFVHFEKIKQLP